MTSLQLLGQVGRGGVGLALDVARETFQDPLSDRLLLQPLGVLDQRRLIGHQLRDAVLFQLRRNEVD